MLRKQPTSLMLKAFIQNIPSLLLSMSCFKICLLISSALGVVFQLACAIIFRRIRHSSSVFTYLSACSVNKAVLCAMNLIEFFYHIYFDQSYWMNVFTARFTIPTLSFLYFNGVFLDLLMIIERFSIFNQRVKSVMSRAKPGCICLLATLSSLILHIPVFFFVSVDRRSNVDPNPTWYLKLSPMLNSLPGLGYTMFIWFTRDIFFMFNQLIISIRSIVYIREHIKKKLIRNQDIMFLSKYNSADLRSTLMVLIICFISLVEHLIILLTCFNVVLYSEEIEFGKSHILTATYMSFTRLLDFFLFFGFNTVFKKEVQRIGHVLRPLFCLKPKSTYL